MALYRFIFTSGHAEDIELTSLQKVASSINGSTQQLIWENIPNSPKHLAEIKLDQIAAILILEDKAK